MNLKIVGVADIVGMAVASVVAAFALVFFVALVDCSGVNVNLQQYECKNSVTNSNGTITFEECIKSDGKLDSQGGEVDSDILPSVKKEDGPGSFLYQGPFEKMCASQKWTCENKQAPMVQALCAEAEKKRRLN